MALTSPVKDLWSFWREIQKKTMRAANLALVADPGPLRDQWQEALLLESRYPDRLCVVALDRPEPISADVALVLVDASVPQLSRSFPALAGFDRRHLVALATSDADDPLFRREVAAALEILPGQLLASPSPAQGAREICQHLTDQIHDFLIPLARQFPLFREPASWDEINATAKQNALVGLLPLPGSDMPIMTANQIKMVLRLAAIYDLPLTGDRAKELMAVVGGGFGLRTAARQLVKFVPGPGWFVSGGIGYSGTVAMGKAALEYFKRSTLSPDEAALPRAIARTPDSE